MELQYRLQPGELEGVGDHLRVSLGPGELAGIGEKVWTFRKGSSPEFSSERSSFPSSALGHGGKGVKTTRKFP